MGTMEIIAVRNYFGESENELNKICLPSIFRQSSVHKDSLMNTGNPSINLGFI